MEGASLIRTLGKVWGDQAPLRLAELFEIIMKQSRYLSSNGPSTAESCALRITFMLPALLRCACTPL